jgi:hypothetical protein
MTFLRRGWIILSNFACSTEIQIGSSPYESKRDHDFAGTDAGEMVLVEKMQLKKMQ